MAEIPNPQVDRSAERSFEERLAGARPVTAEDLDAVVTALGECPQGCSSNTEDIHVSVVSGHRGPHR